MTGRFALRRGLRGGWPGGIGWAALAALAVALMALAVVVVMLVLAGGGAAAAAEGEEAPAEDPHPWSAQFVQSDKIEMYPFPGFSSYILVNLTNYGPGNLTLNMIGEIDGPFNITIITEEIMLQPRSMMVYFLVSLTKTQFQPTVGNVTFTVVGWSGEEPLIKSYNLSFNIEINPFFNGNPYIGIYHNDQVSLYHNQTIMRFIRLAIYHPYNQTDNLTISWNASYPEGLIFNQSHGYMNIIPGTYFWIQINYTYDGSRINSTINITLEAVNWTGAPLPDLPRSLELNITTVESEVKLEVQWPQESLLIENIMYSYWYNHFILPVENTGNVDLIVDIFINETYDDLSIDSYNNDDDGFHRTITIPFGSVHNMPFTVYNGQYLEPGNYPLNVTIIGRADWPQLENLSVKISKNITLEMPGYSIISLSNCGYYGTIEPGTWDVEECVLYYRGNIPDNITITVDNMQEIRKQNIRVKIEPAVLNVEANREYTFRVSIYVTGFYRSGEQDIVFNATSEYYSSVYATYTRTLILNGPNELMAVSCLGAFVVMAIGALAFFAIKFREKWESRNHARR